MSIRANVDKDPMEKSKNGMSPLLSPGQFRTLGALILIALGSVFFLGQARILDYSSSWWVIFIAIPGLVLLAAASITLRRTGTFSGLALTQAVLGGICIVLSIIFIFDPIWSFTHGWTLDRYFPFLRTINWDSVWPWFLVVPGAAILYSAVQRRNVGTGVFGGALIVVGFVFILDISWDVVWPLAIVAAGVGLLLGGMRRQS